MALSFRPLNKEEKHILDVLLSQNFPGSNEIKRQVEDVLVRSSCDCGCKSIEFSTKSDIKVQSNVRVPVEATYTKKGNPYLILLHVLDGKISELEFVSFGDLPDLEYPEANDIKIKNLK